ncbi:urease accessory protein UreE [Mycobacterium sp. 155]|uniref:urease accessory protein UreE n=1 Tax=Mycobacterium sp. 155 TaxID=1157943 RepID=UPI000366FE63|nr:urease accessory protein UreE [Mycobacterium sp. 155]
MSTNNVVTAKLGSIETIDSVEIDPVILTADERARGHMKVRSEGGREVRISLDRGSDLDDGDVLAMDGHVAVVVQACDEDILVVSPATARDWGAAAFVMGNLHRPVRFSDDAMRTPYEHSTGQALDEAGIAYTRTTAPLVGQRIRAVGGHSHD